MATPALSMPGSVTGVPAPRSRAPLAIGVALVALAIAGGALWFSTSGRRTETVEKPPAVERPPTPAPVPAAPPLPVPVAAPTMPPPAPPIPAPPAPEPAVARPHRRPAARAKDVAPAPGGSTPASGANNAPLIE